MLQLGSSGVVKELPRTTRWASTNSTLPVRGKTRTELFHLRDTNLRFSMEMLVKREAREMQRARASYRWRLTSYTQRIPLNSLSVPIPHKQLTTPMECETRRPPIKSDLVDEMGGQNIVDESFCPFRNYLFPNISTGQTGLNMNESLCPSRSYFVFTIC